MTDQGSDWEAPRHLFEPLRPGKNISPPVVRPLQQLPFNELDWTDIQKLCARLFGLRPGVGFCREYGTSGQGQLGIDIYSSYIQGKWLKWHMYECKHYPDGIVPSVVSAALKKFIESDHPVKVDRFTLVVTCKVRDRKVDDEFMRLTERIRENGVDAMLCDVDKLSAELEQHEHLVFRAFGRDVYRAFYLREPEVQ